MFFQDHIKGILYAQHANKFTIITGNTSSQTFIYLKFIKTVLIIKFCYYAISFDICGKANSN
jgi:hypothetical protein